MASKSFSKLIPCFSIARSHSVVGRIRPLASTTQYLFGRKISNHHFVVRSFSSRPTTSSLNDPSPNWSNRPPKETILLDGCDFEHWLCVVENPDPNWTRDQLIDHYIKILAKVVGSEEEARMKIYSVSTKHYFAFGANVSEDLSYKLKELPELRWVLPDSYLDVKNKDYGGEPFINGEAVPYDPKYHEEWVRNNARANERSRRNDRPRNFDRSRNFERRGEMRSSGGPAPPMNQGYQGTPSPPPHNATQSPPPPMQNPNFSRPPPSQGPPPTSNVGYQNQIPNPGYQGGGGGYQGGNPGYQPSPNPNMPPQPHYVAQSQPLQNPNFNRPPPPPAAQNYYQSGGAPGYEPSGGAPGYKPSGGTPGYQQGSAPAYQQGGAPGYQSNGGVYSNQQDNPNHNLAQSGGGGYPGGYQGGNVPSQGPGVPTGGDKVY